MVDSWPAYKLWQDSNYLIENVSLSFEFIEKIGEKTLIPLRTHFTKYDKGTEWLGEEKKLPFGEFMQHWLEEKTWCKYFLLLDKLLTSFLTNRQRKRSFRGILLSRESSNE